MAFAALPLPRHRFIKAMGSAPTLVILIDKSDITGAAITVPAIVPNAKQRRGIKNKTSGDVHGS